MKICYTYFEIVPKIENCPNRKGSQKDLIEICKKSWKKYGWDLVVLSEKDAENHPFYEEYKQAISSLPSANPPPYEYHCFMRWLAVSNNGGGVMIDYDVINLGLEDFEFFDFSQLTIYQGHVPCVVSGQAEHYLEIAKKFLEIKEDKKCYCFFKNKPHTSDMLMLASENIIFNKLNFVEDYPKIGKLVHCSQGTCKNKNKYEIMNELYNNNL